VEEVVFTSAETSRQIGVQDRVHQPQSPGEDHAIISFSSSYPPSRRSVAAAGAAGEPGRPGRQPPHRPDLRDTPFPHLPNGLPGRPTLQRPLFASAEDPLTEEDLTSLPG
jgi:hypothetical protein